MIGAIIGDIIGMPFEFNPHKSTEFELVTPRCTFTDDTVLTCAVAEALMKVFNYKPEKILIEHEENFKSELIKSMLKLGNMYPDAGYGMRFYNWLLQQEPKPYNSLGNGSAMRVAPVAWAFDELEQVEKFAALSAVVTHNNPEGIRGAKAVASAIFLARNNKSQAEIKDYISDKYYYNLTRKIENIRWDYKFDETCPGSVPEAIIAYLEAKDFESAVRNAVSLGGDADTQADIAGAIAEASFGIPDEIILACLSKLDDNLSGIVQRWREFLKK
ncbi:MAG: ADP-ribosylglycohydrolase family protein [Synergistaceae bacterium]|nr:ADP-ribosylglycohydrolase family protein [Synergistaceae bacterium]